MSSSFPIQYYTGIELGPMNEYFVPAAAATFVQGALVVADGTPEINECGADPALILGVAKGKAADKFIWENRIPVSVLNSQILLGLCVTGTLLASHVGASFGIVKNAAGFWALDISDTVNTRCIVDRVDLVNQIAWVRFFAANLQLDAVAS